MDGRPWASQDYWCISKQQPWRCNPIQRLQERRSARVLVLTRPMFLWNSGRCLSTRWDCTWSWAVRECAGSSCLPITTTVIRWSLGGSPLPIWYPKHTQTNASLLTLRLKELNFSSLFPSPLFFPWSISHISSWIFSKITLVFQDSSWPVLIVGPSGVESTE